MEHLVPVVCRRVRSADDERSKLIEPIFALFCMTPHPECLMHDIAATSNVRITIGGKKIPEARTIS
jgi:hypothetical protein